MTVQTAQVQLTTTMTAEEILAQIVAGKTLASTLEGCSTNVLKCEFNEYNLYYGHPDGLEGEDYSVHFDGIRIVTRMMSEGNVRLY